MGTSVPVHGECSDHLHTVTMLPLTLLLVLPCLLLLPHTQGELCTQQVEELRLHLREEMKIEMEAMRVQVKAEFEEMFEKREETMMLEMKTVLRAELKKEMETEEEARKGKCEAAEAAKKTEIEKQEGTMKQELTSIEKSLTTAVSQVKDLPYVMSCAYQDGWSRASSTITYDSLLSDYNNADKPNGGDGRMDITTGVFTCLTAGHYTVTYSGHVRVDPGEDVSIYLHHNGERVEESQWYSYQSYENGGVIYDQGSRTVILHLAVGDTLELRTSDCTAGISRLTYCVFLAGWDY